MRRSLMSLTIALATVALVAPAWAATTITEVVPRRVSAPVDKECQFEVVADDRLEQKASSSFDDSRTLLKGAISGKQVTVFERVGPANTIEIESLGSTTITRQSDSTYTLVQKGSGFWFDDGSLSGTPELLRFTGSIRAVGYYDAATFTFQPVTRTISGVTSSICEMLVTGLKTRH